MQTQSMTVSVDASTVEQRPFAFNQLRSWDRSEKIWDFWNEE